MYPFVQDSRKKWMFELDGEKSKKKKEKEIRLLRTPLEGQKEEENKLKTLKDTAPLFLYEGTIHSTCG